MGQVIIFRKINQVKGHATQYSLGKDYFQNSLGESQDWNDSYLQTQSVDFNLELDNIRFSNSTENTPYHMYTDQGLLQSSGTDHEANTIDGTDLKINTISSHPDGNSVRLNIENISDVTLIVDDLEVVQSSADYDVPNFEPTVISWRNENYRI